MKHRKEYQPWREWEDNLIRNHYPTLGPRYCMKQMDERTYSDVKNRAWQLGVRRSSRYEIHRKAVKELLGQNKTQKAISMRLKISRQTVRRYQQKLKQERGAA